MKRSAACRSVELTKRIEFQARDPFVRGGDPANRGEFAGRVEHGCRSSPPGPAVAKDLNES